MEIAECGAACLSMVMGYYNKWIPMSKLRIDCGVSRDGSNAKNILRAARNFGFTAKGFKFEPEDLKKKGMFPCIIHWNFNHFVVLKGFRGNKAYINDPENGSTSVSMEEFDKAFTGVTILITPGEEQTEEGARKSIFSHALERMEGAWGVAAFLTVVMAVSYIIGIINPLLTRVFVDRILSGTDENWLMPYLAIMLSVAVIYIIAMIIERAYKLRVNGKLSVMGSTSYMWKILNLPLEFFSQRSSEEIIIKHSMNAEISRTIVNTFAPLVFGSIMMLLYLFVMLRQSVILTVVALLALVINFFVTSIVSSRNVNRMRRQMRDVAKLSTATVGGIAMVESIKTNGAENGFFETWAGYQAAANTGEVYHSGRNATLGFIPEFITGLANLIVLFLGTAFIMNGEFTIGMILAFQGFMSVFLSPSNAVMAADSAILRMKTEMESIEDVMAYPEDEYLSIDKARSAEKEEENFNKLSGKVEINNLSFGYSKLSEPLIKDFSMKLETGSRVAIVGRSGCGKSTIAKLMSGLYKPWDGQILFDGKPIYDIDRSVFTGSVAVVDQDIILFDDTIENNIKMWDDTIEDFEMILAARDAQLHEDIMGRSGGYQYVIAEGGKDLSGGQRQRLEIARVLASDPSIIILDEATSALDARTEYEVIKSIKARGITSVVIAHRLSTIRDCDEIIVMDRGEIVQRGNHDTLMAEGGLYAELIADE
ncbi:MAG: ATP-binding cassette domain-containing protein [Lachnospiraceae bacterium]|nr:ATP-binding cassette domain-containing protein [Lachnospiraceae bacterium]